MIWNFDKVLNDKAPHFDQRQAAQVRPRLPSVASYRKIDDMTVEVTTKVGRQLLPLPDAVVPGLEPGAVREARAGLGQVRHRARPAPARSSSPGWCRANAPNWSRTPPTGTRSALPKVDRMILVPRPRRSTRTNALLSGQVDLIETPAPDVVPRLQAGRHEDRRERDAARLELSSPLLPGSPWTDIRLRKAANLAIDRDDIVAAAERPGQARVRRRSTRPALVRQAELRDQVRPDEARQLVAEAGYSPQKPLQDHASSIAPGGSGQMLSLPMNEYIQQSLKEVGIEVEFKVVELEVLYTPGARARRAR